MGLSKGVSLKTETQQDTDGTIHKLTGPKGRPGSGYESNTKTVRPGTSGTKNQYTDDPGTSPLTDRGARIARNRGTARTGGGSRALASQPRTIIP